MANLDNFAVGQDPNQPSRPGCRPTELHTLGLPSRLGQPLTDHSQSAERSVWPWSAGRPDSSTPAAKRGRSESPTEPDQTARPSQGPRGPPAKAASSAHADWNYVGVEEAELSAAIEDNIREYQAEHVAARQHRARLAPTVPKSAYGGPQRAFVPRLNLPPRSNEAAASAASSIAEASAPASSAAYPSPRDQVAIGLGQMSLGPAHPGRGKGT